MIGENSFTRAYIFILSASELGYSAHFSSQLEDSLPVLPHDATTGGSLKAFLQGLSLSISKAYHWKMARLIAQRINVRTGSSAVKAAAGEQRR